MRKWYFFSMKATTVKLQGSLLEDLEANKPPDQSLTAYVRSVLQGNLDRLKIQQAAFAYRDFVESGEEERKWLDEWGRADLSVPPCGEKGSS